MIQIGIYKITSPSNKVYIGQSVNIRLRFRQYKYFLSYKNCIGPKLHNSFKKYGFNNHQFQIIEECSIKNLDNRELFWKKVYLNYKNNDWSQVLFCELHDKGGGPKSKETKKKIGNSNKGTRGYPKGKKRKKGFLLNFTEKERKEINKRISEGNKKKKPRSLKTKNNKPRSIQHKLNIGKSNKGIIRNNKPILQYDLEGNFIQEWISITEAKKIHKGDIQACCNNKQKKAGGFIWIFKQV